MRSISGLLFNTVAINNQDPFIVNTTYYINVREIRRGTQNKQSRNTGSIGHTRQGRRHTKHNTEN